jgi:hypothetical protein
MNSIVTGGMFGCFNTGTSIEQIRSKFSTNVIGRDVYCISSSVSVSEIQSFYWEVKLGGELIFTGDDVSLIFDLSNNGLYEISLEVTDVDGNQDTSSSNVVFDVTTREVSTNQNQGSGYISGYSGNFTQSQPLPKIEMLGIKEEEINIEVVFL